MLAHLMDDVVQSTIQFFAWGIAPQCIAGAFEGVVGINLSENQVFVGSDQTVRQTGNFNLLFALPFLAIQSESNIADVGDEPDRRQRMPLSGDLLTPFQRGADVGSHRCSLR